MRRHFERCLGKEWEGAIHPKLFRMVPGSDRIVLLWPARGGVVDMSSFNDQIVAAVQRAVTPAEIEIRGMNKL